MSEKELKSGIVSEPPMFRGYDRSSCQSTGRRLILSGLMWEVLGFVIMTVCFKLSLHIGENAEVTHLLAIGLGALFAFTGVLISVIGIKMLMIYTDICKRGDNVLGVLQEHNGTRVQAQIEHGGLIERIYFMEEDLGEAFREDARIGIKILGNEFVVSKKFL